MCAIGLAGAVGIVLLWIVDLLVYHRLLHAAFVQGLALERYYVWMPPLRTGVDTEFRTRDVVPRVIWFYVGSAGIALVLSIASLSLWLAPRSLWLAVAAPAICALSATVVLRALVRSTLEDRSANTAAAQDAATPCAPAR